MADSRAEIVARSSVSGVRKPYEPTAEPTRLGGMSAFDPGRRGLRVLAAIAAAVALGAAYLVWQAQPDPVTVPMLATTMASGQPNPAELVVAVSGQVQRPGLVRLPAGARVADALQAAGGALPGTDLSAVNLARKVVDGELIAIGVVVTGAAQAGPLNLNTATLAQLDALPGVGPVLAQRIIDMRAKRGGFTKVDELRQVDGIGEETFARLKDLVVV
ncbi:competence protein ComEA [Rhizocola hellebori]|uniref:Competence protein ComEA n=1 Tax=Rhizocola hellebori TaxID=1392758 RepID=A0A8J3Q3D6_9ACTN|nr:competence protein ComEA [Rhizocola hellebori]